MARESIHSVWPFCSCYAARTLFLFDWLAALAYVSYSQLEIDDVLAAAGRDTAADNDEGEVQVSIIHLTDSHSGLKDLSGCTNDCCDV
jgi:hypothetical protein